MLSDVCLGENKGFEVLLDKPVCCTWTPGWCERDYCSGCGAEQRPLFKQFKVYGTWRFTPLPTLYSWNMQNRKEKEKEERCWMRNISRVMVCRNIERQNAAVFPPGWKTQRPDAETPNDTNSHVMWSPSMLKLDGNVVMPPPSPFLRRSFWSRLPPSAFRSHIYFPSFNLLWLTSTTTARFSRWERERES